MIKIRHRTSGLKEVQLPPSKSVLNRVLVLEALANELRAVEESWPRDCIALHKALSVKDGIIDIGLAGTAMRFATAFHAQQKNSLCITGTERMLNRPIRELVEALNFLGADIQYLGQEGFPPLRISAATMVSSPLHISGAVSSQFVTALMLIASQIEGGLEIHLTPPLVSAPYLHLSADIMREYGIEVNWITNYSIRISEGPIQAQSNQIIESDWSAAAYFYGLIAIGHFDRLKLKGLTLNSSQGDKACASLFHPLGVETSIDEDGISISKRSRTLETYQANLIEQPDLAQPLAFTCAALGIDCTLIGLQTLRHKETDRIQAIAECLEQIGLSVVSTENSISFSGLINENSSVVFSSYEDHRMAMSSALLASVMPKTRIAEPEVVEKSFPRFWSELKKIGFEIRTSSEAEF